MRQGRQAFAELTCPRATAEALANGFVDAGATNGAGDRGAAPAVLRLLDDRNVLGLLMIAPAALFLLVFLAYPLGLGFWLGLTDATIGQAGRFVGFANFVSLAHDQIFLLSIFNTTLYTVVASALKFGLGLYLALLLNRRMALKSIIRAVVLLPFVTPTVLSAIAFWWLYDPQFSIISWSLIKLGFIHQYIDFLGHPGTRAGR